MPPEPMLNSDAVSGSAKGRAARGAPVQRALAELRRGAAVRLTGAGGESLVVRAAETAGAGGVTPEAMLLVAASRAALLPLDGSPPPGAVVALRLPAGATDLPALADPSRGGPPPGPLTTVAVPPLADAAIRLAKHGRLLPALLCGGDADGDTLSVSAADVDAYPAHLAAELVEVASAAVPLEAAATSRVVAFRPRDGGAEQVAVLVGAGPLDRPGFPAPLVRLHSECFTGDVLGSLRCDCARSCRGRSAAWRPRAAASCCT